MRITSIFLVKSRTFSRSFSRGSHLQSNHAYLFYSFCFIRINCYQAMEENTKNRISFFFSHLYWNIGSDILRAFFDLSKESTAKLLKNILYFVTSDLIYFFLLLKTIYWELWFGNAQINRCWNFWIIPHQYLSQISYVSSNHESYLKLLQFFIG